MAVPLNDILDPAWVVLELAATARDEALREIVARLRDGKAPLKDAEKFIEQVLGRERTTSTYVGHGVAFPHARTDLVEQIVLGIGRSAAGVEVGPKGERVHLFFLIAVPQRMVTDYLTCVGTLARLTKNEETRAALLAAATAPEVIEILRAGSLKLS